MRIETRIRPELMAYAYDDWLRIMRNGLSAKEARETIERDYELTEEEKAELSKRMLDELERRMEGTR